MVRNVMVDTVVNGGTTEVQTITLSADESVGGNSYGGFFVLFYNDTVVVNNTGQCFDWGADASVIEAALEKSLWQEYKFNQTAAYNSQVNVKRSGLGGSEDAYGYTYTVEFVGDYVRGNIVPLVAETEHDLSNPSYNGVSGRNDLTFSGSYTGSSAGVDEVVIITVEIVDSYSPDSNGPKDDYIWTMADTNGVFVTGAQANITTDVVSLARGISIQFGNTTGHKVGDKWIERIVLCGAQNTGTSPHPAGGYDGLKVEVATLADGSRPVNELSLVGAYQGKSVGFQETFLVPQTFTIADPGYEVQTITVKDTEDSSWANGSPQYRLRYGWPSARGKGDGAVERNATTACIDWDASDREVEEALNSLDTLCDFNEHTWNQDRDETRLPAPCVTVTRREDLVHAPNGYVYSIYYTGNKVSDMNVELIMANATDPTGTGACTGFDTDNGESVSVATIVDGFDAEIYSGSSLAIGDIDDSTSPGKFLGAGKKLPVYKVSGNYWTVQFDSNLGDLEAIDVSGSSLSSSATVSVHDNLVKGMLPHDLPITDLLTGVPYYMRVAARNALGFSDFSSPSSMAVPAEVPPAPEGIAGDVALHINEVQKITVAATHVDEVQVVTTTADYLPEVQEVTISAPEDGAISGNFSLRFPEVQTVTITAGSTISAGSFHLNFTKPITTDGFFPQGSIKYETESTACIDFDATAAEVESAINALPFLTTGDVSVSRSGNGGASYDYGYSYTVSFVGSNVAGNVPLLVASTYGCDAFDVATEDENIMIVSLNDGDALGTDTEIQKVDVFATATIHQGQYQLKLNHTGGSMVTPCIEWDATAADVEAAIENMTNVDSVRVERSGAADYDSDFGYTYSIFFDGHGMMVTPEGRNNPETLEVLMGDEVNCLPFATIVNGVLVDFNGELGDRQQANVTSITVDDGGYDMDAITANSMLLIKPELELLPQVASLIGSAQSLSDYELGRTITLTFEENGSIQQLTCGASAEFAASDGSCSVETVVDGNVLGGTFLLDTSDALSFDATEAEVEAALAEVWDVGTVSVSRSGPTPQLGYEWTITFIDAEGNRPLLDITSSLTGAGASATIAEATQGNELGGSFALVYDNVATGAVSFDVSTADLEALLEAVPGVSMVEVTTDSVVDTEGGRTWTVTFLDAAGDIKALAPETYALTGAGAAVTVVEVTKGSEALGDSLALSWPAPVECSTSQVTKGACGSPAEKVIFELDTAPNFKADPIYVEYELDYTVQKVLINAASLAGIAYENYAASGVFQLGYASAETAYLSAQASSTEVRHALEALPGITSASVSRDYGGRVLEGFVVDAVYGYPFVKCASGETCNFYSSGVQMNDLIRVEGEWYRVATSYESSESTLPLAKLEDSSVALSYTGPTKYGSQLYGWSNGFEWTVTLHAVTTDTVEMLTSPAHSIAPADTAVSISLPDCDGCLYVDGLTPFTQYYMRAQTFNVLGASDYANHIAVMPKAIPGVPTDIEVEAVSGTQLEVFFSPPTSPSGDITQYTVQWDTDYTFANVEASGSDATCWTSGYGSCEVEGAAITGTPPFSYVMSYLTSGTTYYVRVAARNDVPAQAVSPVGTPPDNTMWCSIVDGVPSDQVPNSPGEVSLTISSRSVLQVMFEEPERDGGRNITTYTVEYDSDASFDSAAYVSKSLAADDLSSLYTDGPLVTYISGIVPGTSYYVRVSAINALGASLPSYSATPLAPMGAPDEPATVVIDASETQATPITEVTVMWDAPAADGGSPIDGYLVEWWTAAMIPEIQEVRMTWDEAPNNDTATSFKLQFGPTTVDTETTGKMEYNIDSYNMRNQLVNLAFNPNIEGHYIIGDVAVSRKSIFNNLGYSWSITFNDDGSLDNGEVLNAGNQVPLLASFVSRDTNSDPELDVIEVQKGVRSQGHAEVQTIFTSGTGKGTAGGVAKSFNLYNGSDTSEVVRGYFRMSFYGSSWSQYVPADCSPELLENALEMLNTVGQVNVTRDLDRDNNGYEWRVTFETNVGDIPAIEVDGTYLYTTNDDAEIEVYDGDTEIDDSTGLKLYDTEIGEEPAEYGAQFVSADDRSFVIPNLTPGTEYYVHVSARNTYGTSLRTSAAPEFLAPPKQVPGLPNDVTVSVNTGVDDSLVVSYATPDSDGGDDIIRYRVELDTDEEFPDPVAVEDIYCPTDNKRTVWEVKAKGGAQYISGGYFSLKLSANGYDYYTDDISYDAPAMQADEVGVYELLDFTFETTNRTSRVKPSSSTLGKLFINDRIKIEGSRYENEIYTVRHTEDFGVSGFGPNPTVYLNLSSTFDGDAMNQAKVWRLTGGRGDATTSRVYCEYDDIYCDDARIRISGSMEAKLETFSDAITEGVNVIRTGPDSTNGYTWRVTFLDDAPTDPYDYALALQETNLVGNGTFNNVPDVEVTQLVDGEVYSSCTGSQVVPSTGGLDMGQYYYARVVAVNTMGYSLSQVAESSEKPMVTPGKPTSVTLSTMSAESLRVVFDVPTSDGGDDITAYQIEYATSADFSDAQTTSVTYLDGGSPFYKTITGLETGTFYYVRVSAMNSQGYGSTQVSTPTNLNPYEEPGAPTNVALGVTSDSMLTVSFDEPTDNGGDAISAYYVEWDTSSSFSTGSSSPHKGSVTVDATENSYTITLLSENTVYYTRVSCINSAGYGTTQTSSPASAYPALQVPGRPHTLTAAAGTDSATIDVTWQYPRVPAHEIPCGGTVDDPDDCPTAFGGTLAESTGGDDLTEYEVEYNEYADFSGQDGGSSTTTATSLTVEQLTSGRMYYIRVLARNTVGSGDFCSQSGADCPATGTSLSAYAA